VSRNHFGSVRQLPSGRWRATYRHAGHEFVAPSTYGSKSHANTYLAATLADIERKTWTDPRLSGETFKKVAEEWLSSNPDKRQSTIARDKSILSNHCYPTLGSKKIGDITTGDVQNLVNRWGKSQAASTVGRQKTCMTAVFSFAVDRGKILRSPVHKIKLPRVEKAKRHNLTSEDIAKLAEATGDKWSASIYLGAVGGLRWGEVFALRVDSLDLDAGTVTVDAGISRGEQGESVEEGPKTAAGIRTLSIPAALVDILRTHVETQTIPDDGLLFPDDRGGLVRASNWRRRVWEPAVEKAKLDSITPALGFHDLRRLAATSMVMAGVDPKTLQTRLGHASIRTSLDLYAQVTTESDRAAADAMGSAIFKTKSHVGRTRKSVWLKTEEKHPLTWWALEDSNLRPQPCEGCALTN
jgi:integrase